jgi:hypothetical protein
MTGIGTIPDAQRVAFACKVHAATACRTLRIGRLGGFARSAVQSLPVRALPDFMPLLTLCQIMVG